jgi:hypothetical protein
VAGFEDEDDDEDEYEAPHLYRRIFGMRKQPFVTWQILRIRYRMELTPG